MMKQPSCWRMFFNTSYRDECTFYNRDPTKTLCICNRTWGSLPAFEDNIAPPMSTTKYSRLPVLSWPMFQCKGCCNSWLNWQLACYLPSSREDLSCFLPLWNREMKVRKVRSCEKQNLRSPTRLWHISGKQKTLNICTTTCITLPFVLFMFLTEHSKNVFLGG